MDMLENRTFDELAVGDTASLSRTVTERDIRLFATLSGEVAPDRCTTEGAAGLADGAAISPGLWSTALFSTLLGTSLPGPGTTQLSQSLRFLAPAVPGSAVEVRVTLTAAAPIGTAIMAGDRQAGTLFTQSGGQGLAHLRLDWAVPGMTAGDAKILDFQIFS